MAQIDDIDAPEPVYDGNGVELAIGDEVEWGSIGEAPIAGKVIAFRLQDGAQQVWVAWRNGRETWCCPSYVAA